MGWGFHASETVTQVGVSWCQKWDSGKLQINLETQEGIGEKNEDKARRTHIYLLL